MAFNSYCNLNSVLSDFFSERDALFLSGSHGVSSILHFFWSLNLNIFFNERKGYGTMNIRDRLHSVSRQMHIYWHISMKLWNINIFGAVGEFSIGFQLFYHRYGVWSAEIEVSGENKFSAHAFIYMYPHLKGTLLNFIRFGLFC